MATAHSRVVFSLLRLVPEGAPPLDDLLGRAAADSQLQTRACDEVRGACIFGHIMRILIPHVDDPGADFDASGPGSDRREQWKRRGELASKVVDPKVSSIHPDSFRLDGEVNR